MPKALLSQVELTTFGSVAAQLPGDIRIVHVADLVERLRKCTPLEVLNVLFNTDELLSQPVAGCRCALLSYRQERGTNGLSSAEASAYAHVTLDGDAFRGVIAAAIKLGADSLWCDAWCYREPGEYDHAHFCKTLSSVVSSVCFVVWLPRSKHGSSAQYAYRLFCTFEAACVELRSLPVAVAGAGQSSFQTRLRYSGSFTPAIGADGTLDALCRLNAAFYFAVVGAICYVITQLVWGLDQLSKCDGNFTTNSRCWNRVDAVDEGFGAVVIFCFSLPLVWFGSRATIGQQVRLAKNACHVLRIMHRASNQVGEASSQTAQQRLSTVAGLGLRQNLAWLPAYDRRDTLVVAKLLGELNPEDALDAVEMRALAFSAYTAAQQLSSPGDDSARTQTLRAWLAEKDMVLEATRMRALTADARQASGSQCGCGPAASVCTTRLDTAEVGHGATSASESGIPSRPLVGQTWLDGLPAPSGLAEDGIPLKSLRKFGWVHTVSAGGFLVTPHGTITASILPKGVWSVGGAVALKNLRLANVCTVILSTYGMLTLGMFIIYHWDDNLAHPFTGMGTVYGLEFFLSSFCALAWLAANAAVVSADFYNWRTSRRMPLPFVVMSTVKRNATVLVLLVAAAANFAWQISLCVTKIQGNSVDHRIAWRMESNYTRLLQQGLCFLFFGFYQTPLALSNLVACACFQSNLKAAQEVLM